MVSGGVATLTDLILFKLFLLLAVSVLPAAVISGTAGTVLNFFGTRYYVYGETDKQKIKPWTQFALYIPAALISLGIIQVILLIFHLWLGFDPLLVKVAGVPIVFAWTVFNGKYIIFNKKNE